MSSPRTRRVTASVKEETLSENDEADGTAQSAPRRGRDRRSPSPGPSTEQVEPQTRRSPARKAPKVEIDMSQDVDAMFDNMPFRRRPRRERSPSPKPAAAAAKVELPKPGRSLAPPVIDADANLDDAFDNIPPRRRGRRGRSPSPDSAVNVKTESSPKASKTRNAPVIDANANIDDAFDNMPSRRSRRARDRSATPPPASPKVKTTESPVPSRSSPRRGQRAAETVSEPLESVKVKTEPVTPAKPTAAELKKAGQVRDF